MTQKEQVRSYVETNPGKTSVQIAKATGIKSANVSSVLVKGWVAGIFKRERPEGAKAGWVYYVQSSPTASESVETRA